MYYIGLMSGTSTDAVDGVLADSSLNIIASHSISLPGSLRQQLLELNAPGHDELAKGAIAANQLADIYAQVVHFLLQLSGLKASDIHAIGAHGQTVRHAPELGYTIQLNSPARLVENTGITVISDFRSRDIAAGGQGAPLVPAFHAALFGQKQGKAVLNLGGIANITILAQEVIGFDTGPANMLMDAWSQARFGQEFDKNGVIAKSGQPSQELLQAMLNEPWFRLPPPKSTGRDLFNLPWLENIIAQTTPDISANDVQATLLNLSSTTITNAIKSYAPTTKELIVCGGGAYNPVLLDSIASKSGCKLTDSGCYGVPAQLMEALAFAWLAKANLENLQACLPSVTGARHASIAGCIYPV